MYGGSYWWSIMSMTLTGITTGVVFLPVFFKLQLTSSYEYLKLRFDPSLRVISSFLFALTMILYLPIVVYIPALAFSQGTSRNSPPEDPQNFSFPVTSINIHMITPIVCVVCIFYTTIGGLKAVVWTDTLQFTVMVAAMVVVLYLGIKSAFGLQNIFRIAYEGGRLDLFE